MRVWWIGMNYQSLSQKQLQDFINLWSEVYGETLELLEAEERANHILALLETLVTIKYQ